MQDHLKRLAVTQNGYGLAEEKAFGLITLKLAMNLFEGATGCHEWEAGFLLAEFILSNPGVFKGRTQRLTKQCRTACQHVVGS